MRNCIRLDHELDRNTYLNDLFHHYTYLDEKVCFFAPSTQCQWFIPVYKLDEYANDRLLQKDAFFSFATYRNRRHDTASLYNIYAWSVDIDYLDESKNPWDMAQFILDEANIPKPNYAEYGHRLRFIYLLAEPLQLRKGKKQKLLKGFKFMQKCVAQMINDAVPCANAESCPPTSFFRLPHSINSKSNDVIHVEKLSDITWTMQEIFEEWIPNSMIDKSGNVDSWKAKWKKNQKKQKKMHRECVSEFTLWQNRMDVLKRLRKNPNIPREKLCFYYAIGLLNCSNQNHNEIIDDLLLFNQGFLHPLEEKEIRSKFRTIHPYRIKNQTMADALNIPVSAFTTQKTFHRKEYDAIRYEKKKQYKEKHGQTHEAKVNKRRQQIESLLATGETLVFIAKKLKVSLSTIKRDVKVIYEKQAKLEEEKLNEFIGSTTKVKDICIPVKTLMKMTKHEIIDTCKTFLKLSEENMRYVLGILNNPKGFDRSKPIIIPLGCS